MNFLIYDKHGIVIHGLNIEHTVTKFQVEDALKDYLRISKPTNSVEFNISGFRMYIYKTLKVNSLEFKFNRLNLGV